MTAKFDWYQTTVRAKDPQASGLVSYLLRAFDLSDYVPGRGLNGYHHGAKVVRGSETLATLSWGGQPGINVHASAENAPILAQAVRDFTHEARIKHTPTRLDAALDWVEKGLFDTLATRLIDFALAEGLALDKRGDWDRGIGRTLYLGSRTSAIYVRLYEKGHEQGFNPFHPLYYWVRFEAEIKPKGAARELLMDWTPEDTLSAGWVPAALTAIGYFHQLKPKSVGTVWRPSSEQRARSALIKQYGAVLTKWAAEVGGWDQLGPEIRDSIDTMQRERQQVEAAA